MVKQSLLLAFITVACEAMGQDAPCVPESAAMVETIRAYARIEASFVGTRGVSERVLEAMGQTDRHRFVPGRSCSVAYIDGPVLIGQGQTISQPFIVALMTDLAAAKFDDTVLEVGTGSGYQAAVLARLVRKVCTVEIIPPLAEAAANVLRELGYDNVSVKVGDVAEFDQPSAWGICDAALLRTAPLSTARPQLSRRPPLPYRDEFTAERRTPRSLFRAPFPALWSAPAPAQALVREYGRGSGPFRGCRLVSNRADALSCRSFLQ